MGVGIPCLLHLAALVLALLLSTASCADLYAVVYKGCANQTFPGGGPPATVAALSSALAAQSASAKFYKTSSASASSASASVSGLFQCRGDLSAADCSSCVSRAMASWPDLCGNAVAARVQLNGCLALYEVSGFPQVSGVQMLFKTCGSGGGGAEDFETRRDTAFAQLEGGAGTSAGGFFATSFQQVYALAQCEGDLSNVDCSNCVTQAVQRVEVECGGAPSGQVYLEKCYITYSYYPHGVPHGGGGGLGGQQPTHTPFHCSVKLKLCVWLAEATRGGSEVHNGERYPESVVPAPGRPELVPLPQEGGRLLRGRAVAAAHIAAATGEAGDHLGGRVQLQRHDPRRRLPGRDLFFFVILNLGLSAAVVVDGRCRGPQSLPFRRSGHRRAAGALLIDRRRWLLRRAWTICFCEINLVYKLRGL